MNSCFLCVICRQCMICKCTDLCHKLERVEETAPCARGWASSSGNCNVLCRRRRNKNKWKNNSNTNCVLLTTTNRRRRRESKATATMTLVLLACCGTWVLCACCWGLQAFPPFSYTYYLLAKIHYGSPFQPSLLPADNSIGPNAERFWMGRNSLLVLRLGFNTGMLGQPRPN